jgi:hypothetical protein
MHACAHGAHATMLLGAARILKQLQGTLRVKCDFVVTCWFILILLTTTKFKKYKCRELSCLSFSLLKNNAKVQNVIIIIRFYNDSIMQNKHVYNKIVKLNDKETIPLPIDDPHVFFMLSLVYIWHFQTLFTLFRYSLNIEGNWVSEYEDQIMVFIAKAFIKL